MLFRSAKSHRSAASQWLRGVVVDLFADDGVVEPGVTVQTLFGSFDALRTQYILDPDDDRGGLRIRAWYV